jgi:hypothetical protein
MLHYTTSPFSDKMKLMKKEDLRERLCGQYCSFYKPGKDEELSCKGFIIFDKLLDEQKEVPSVTDELLLSIETENDLFREVCRRCPFFEQDCDFAAWKRGEHMHVARGAVNPCGGFLCLGHCIDHGTVDIQDVNRVI